MSKVLLLAPQSESNGRLGDLLTQFGSEATTWIRSPEKVGGSPEFFEGFFMAVVARLYCGSMEETAYFVKRIRGTRPHLPMIAYGRYAHALVPLQAAGCNFAIGAYTEEALHGNIVELAEKIHFATAWLRL